MHRQFEVIGLIMGNIHENTTKLWLPRCKRNLSPSMPGTSLCPSWREYQHLEYTHIERVLARSHNVAH